MVRVFSNIALRWPEVQFVKRVAAHYPGYVMNLYLYQINSHNKNLLHWIDKEIYQHDRKVSSDSRVHGSVGGDPRHPE